MDSQIQKFTSVEFFYDKVLEVLEYHSCEHIDISDALHEANKMYEIEIAKAYEKGYEEGVKYTDGLISSERFPF